MTKGAYVDSIAIRLKDFHKPSDGGRNATNRSRNDRRLPALGVILCRWPL